MKRNALSRFVADYGMLFVLLLLCAYFSAATVEMQYPTGATAAQQLARQILTQFGKEAQTLIIARDTRDDAEFADALSDQLAAAGATVLEVVKGPPANAREALDKIAAAQRRLDVIACNHVTAAWGIFDNFPVKYPTLGKAKVMRAEGYRWPNFLKAENLLNVANQIAVIAIIAVGMTMVIITAGIDLSVGSLIALSAVVTAVLIRDFAGAEQASAHGMIACSAGGILVCGVIGLISGVMVTVFGIPAFIATLAMMLVANGLAFILAKGQSIYQVPESFVWLGRGAGWGIPNAVLLMLLLYTAAHVVMTRMPLGRYIYAVGGNQEAARLSGVPVKRVLLFVYTVCGMLAGLGGIVMASQLKSGAPTYGQLYELYVIAAVVVGGASLSGGEGKVLGTLIGAFIIAVIQNGMNLTGVESYTQKVILGLVILGAVLLDMLKRRSWALHRAA
ncbi:MAG: ABC transporter permease [Verrucomicrobia bacterium]|nr:ABC transporter permease [Verrucomicrobiota bacterium]